MLLWRPLFSVAMPVVGIWGALTARTHAVVVMELVVVIGEKDIVSLSGRIAGLAHLVAAIPPALWRRCAISSSVSAR
jgi:hypothetical protein